MKVLATVECILDEDEKVAMSWNQYVSYNIKGEISNIELREIKGTWDLSIIEHLMKMKEKSDVYVYIPPNGIHINILEELGFVREKSENNTLVFLGKKED